MDLPYLSIDLVHYSTQLLRLLHAVDIWPCGGLYKGLYAQEAARRYVSIWLPLMASCKDDEERSQLIPPLDVQYIWLVHRLSPVAYQRDTKALNGGTPMNALPSTDPLMGPFSFTDGLISDGANPYVQHTIKRWEARAGSSEPFFPPRPLSVLEKDERLLNLSPGQMLDGITFDLMGSVGQQAGFLHSCLRPWYLERPFLEQAQLRYRKFWHTHRSRKDITVVPMLDIDLMWHTHMGCSSSYASDCQQAFSRILNHDDSIVENSLSTSFMDTLAAFNSLFPSELYNPPPTWLVPPETRHPIEYVVGNGLLQLLLRPGARSSPQDIKDLAHIISASNCAGGHALYLTWMLSEEAGAVQAETSSGQKKLLGMLKSLTRSFRNNTSHDKDAKQQDLMVRMIKKALGFSTFNHLPFSMSHDYWAMFRVRDQSSWGVRDDNLALNPSADPATNQTPFFCPGCGLSPCCCQTRGYSPYELALFDFLLPTSLMVWNRIGGAYLNNPLASKHVADIIAPRTASSSEAANGLALLTGSRDWPGIIVGEIVCSDDEIKRRWRLEE